MLSCALLQGYMCLVVHLEGYMCLAVHCCRVKCAWLCTVAGLYVLGCALLESYMCLVVHC